MNSISKFTKLLSTTILVAMSAASANAATYYVSPSGNDAAAGTSLAAPFRNIQKCATVARAGDTCLIRGGTYRETVTPASSGGSGAPITFDSYNGERVIISGANVIPSSSFTVYSGSTYKAPIANLGTGLNQIFMSGAVQSEARFPDVASPGLGYFVPLLNAVWPALGNFSVQSTSKIISPAGLLNSQAAGMWNGGLYAGIHYAGFQVQTANINSSISGSLAITPTSSKWYLPPFDRGEDGRGFISGVLNALNLPGEWVVQGGTLYIKLPTGQTPASTVIEAKARQLAFNLTGKSFINVKKLEVIGAGLMMYGGSNNVIDGAKFSFIHQRKFSTNDGALNESGIYLAGRNHTIRNSNISYSSGGCVKLLGLNHTVTNSIIHDCGYNGSGSVIGIGVDQNTESPTSARGGHSITHNTLYNSSNIVISMGRDVNYFFATGRAHIPYYKTGLPTPYLKSIITNNEIYNCSILSRDLGGHFYAHGIDGGGTEIANNVIHDNLEHDGKYGFSVYLDEGTYNFNTHNNIVWLGREGGGLRKGFYAAGNGTSGAATQVINTPSFTSINYNSVAPYPQGKARIFKDNTYKFNYTGGVAGLTAADFPGGVKFAFGASIAGDVKFASGASIAGGGAPIPTDKTVPSVPAGLNGTAASATQVNLTWSASTDNAGGSGVGGYKVYKNGLLASTATGTSTSVTGLAANTSYNFTVASFDNAGNNSAQSAIKAIKTPASPSGGTPIPAGCPTRANANIYVAANDFSGIQNCNQWSYRDSKGVNLVYNPTTKQWKGSETYLLIWGNRTHPGNGADVVRRWTANATGSIRITGKVSDSHTICGDGVVASIKKGTGNLWQSTIVNGNTNGFSYDLTTPVVAGNVIDFVVNKRADNSCDSTSFNPTITFTPGVAIPIKLPDVIVTNITYSAGKITATVKNQGTVVTPAGVGVGYFVDGAYKTGTLAGTLAAGASMNIIGNYVIPKGTHNVGALVDDIKRFAESNEANNNLTKSITIP